MRTVAERIAGTAVVVQINIEENPALAARFGVRSIPLTLLLRGGRVIDRLAGAQSEDALLAWLRRHG